MVTLLREKENRPAGPEWRKWLYNVIFEADTKAGKNFAYCGGCTYVPQYNHSSHQYKIAINRLKRLL